MGSEGSPEAAYSEFFKNKYKGISQTQRGWALSVLNDKQLRTKYGLIFYWPDTRMDRGYIVNTTSIYNFPIQGFATAEIMPIVLVAYWHLTRDKDVQILNEVHDSIVAEVSEDSVQWNEELLRKCFTDIVYATLESIYGYKFTTTLGMGFKVSTHWGDTKEEVSYNVTHNGTIRRQVKHG